MSRTHSHSFLFPFALEPDEPIQLTRVCPSCREPHNFQCDEHPDDPHCRECHAEKEHGILIGGPQSPQGSIDRRQKEPVARNGRKPNDLSE